MKYLIVTSALSMILASCSLFNSIDEVKDGDFGYLDRADYISEATLVVEREYPASKDLLKNAPKVYRAAHMIDRILDSEVEVSWSEDISQRKKSENPIKFRNVTISMHRNGEVTDHRNGIVTGYETWAEPSIESLINKTAEQVAAPDGE